ncbi:peptidyl-prolyl cis-trans isomerase, FKBP-type [Sphingobacterium spiritivorum ATCC 33300]|uniref:Peptidyl-prolyl cis-trans isomerase n=1 Tax=Sphingobacterium spiritivorum ATCC 33300 TaxID=525372 RepID=C2FVU5_SPHSI|nr:FKBP-type peptidyl-prolyl cis-trans isomerase [Sphingobacterium spiritivorum]EEI92937.1 peptidyl-prolyl cis-trans isomerase, FKBP-type [Sphingobacterium spiritivorum ATCC 33300]QQS96287.1 FKBP-type peptidyl-prolyl cis-trans isomerase [Sphingobacterium spiritivorum]
MRKVLAVGFLTALTLCAGAQVKKKGTTPAKKGTSTSRPAQQGIVLKNSGDSLSYALGFDIGSSVKPMELPLNIELMKKGLEEALKGSNGKFTKEQNVEIISNGIQKASDAKNAVALKAENEFFAKNKTKPGVITTPEGLQYEIITKTEGPKPTSEDEIVAHYKGTLLDGKTFDSSYDRGTPLTLNLLSVIEGWKLGIPLMSVGSKYRFYIPSKLGYGPNGSGPIPGNSTLIFDIELLEIKKGELKSLPVADMEDDKK